MKSVLIFFILAFASISNATTNKPMAALTLYVDASVTSPTQNGSQSRPYKYLQDAIFVADAAKTTVEIRVATGTYYPDEDILGNVVNNDRDAAFIMPKDVSILGGYPTGFTNINKRNPKLNVCILSGDIQQNLTFKSYHIIDNDFSGTATNTNAILDGFTLQTASHDTGLGGAVFNKNSSAVIQYCIFKDNEANQGGAVYNETGNPNFFNCLFFDNISYTGGNAIRNVNSPALFVNCTIANNDYLTQPGILSNGSTVTIQNTIVWNNNFSLATASGSSPYQVAYSVIEGGFGGTNNTSNDPVFRDLINDDFHLKHCSSAINRGNNAFFLLTSDLDNAQRVVFTTIDIGVYEYGKADVVYVNHAATGADNGSNWTDAFEKLQDAFSSLSTCGNSPVEVWVAQGTYYPDEGTGRVNNSRTNAFKMLPNVALYGGFDGTEGFRTQRDYTNNLTFLSGDLQQNDISSSFNDNAYHVVSNLYTENFTLDSTAVLDGFVIRGGYANGASNSQKYGGGMYNTYASPAVANIIFTENFAALDGGGVFADSSFSNFTSCFFTSNLCSRNGGGMIALRSYMDLFKVDFQYNNASYGNVNSGSSAGGGLYTVYSNLSIDSCKFLNNSAQNYAGGLRLGAGNSSITRSIFNGNIALIGGAIYNVGSFSVNNSIFTNNQCRNLQTTGLAINNGGAISADDGNGQITSCHFEGNSTGHFGGAVHLNFGEYNFTDCQFISNTAIYGFANNPNDYYGYGGAFYLENDAEVLIDRCLFQGNSVTETGSSILSNSELLTVSNSLFHNNTSLEGENLGGSVQIQDFSKIVNCTFSDTLQPVTTNVNATLFCPNCQVKNSIFWTKATIQIFGANIDVSNSIVKGGFASGSNIIDISPNFLDTLTADFSLQRCSPALDMGNNIDTIGTEDLAGNPRIFNANRFAQSAVDLGAYEFQSNYSTFCVCDESATLSGSISGGSYQYSQSVEGVSGSINTGQNVTFGGNNFVEINPPFTIESGAIFLALPEGCN